MEQLTPIILLILWLVVSFLNNKKKPAAPQKTSPRPETTSLPKDSDLKEMLEDLFGGDDDSQPEKKTSPAQPARTTASYEPEYVPEEVFRQPDEQPASAHREFSGETREYYGETYEELMHEQPKSHTFEHTSYEAIEAETRKYDQVSSAIEYQESISETYPVSLETIDTSIPEDVEIDHEKPEEVKSKSIAGRNFLVDFNLRDAVIYSEILNRKFK